MEQAAVISSNPANLSPEFTTWIHKEKSDAKRHQMRVLKASLLMVMGTAMFLLKMQPDWLVDMLGIAEMATPK